MANIVTPNFRISYPHLFKPQLNKLSNQMEFSVTALFQKDADLSKLKAAAAEAITAKWGPDKAKWPKNLRTPFRDQGERIQAAKDAEKTPPSGYEAGSIYLNLKSKQRPGIVDAQMNEIIDETQLYAGCWARASVSCYAYDQAGNRGVSFGLQHIQKVKDGETLSGRPKVEDAFEPVKVDSAEDVFGEESTSII